MAEPGGKLGGKKKTGRRAGLKTRGKKKETPKNVRSREARSIPGEKERYSQSWQKERKRNY